MNVSIIDPLQGDFPEVIEEFLEHGVMKCIAFNRRGTLLAAGCSDGSCIIWDFETRGIAKELKDSDCKTPVTSVCWSKYGHHVLVASIDKSLTLWNVVNGEKVTRITLQQTTLQARLHPGSHTPSVCLACPLSSAPLLVELNTGNTTVLPVSLSDLDNGAVSSRNKFSDGSAPLTPTSAFFNKYGDLIYVGNSKGEILIIDYNNDELYGVVVNSGAAVIKSISFSRNGLYLLTNSNDRTIRVYENHLSQKDGVKALDELRSSFDDLQGHKIYIWDRAGHLVKILEGPKEALTDLAWHPVNTIVVSVSISGLVYIWVKDYTENWSAFAPDFKELEENEEYVEREDEFDLMPETEKVKHSGVNEDEDVDILTMEKESALSDSDMSQEELCFLPAVPSPDVLDLQDKYAGSSSKMIDSNHSGSPLSDEAGQDGHGVNLDSSPVGALGNLIADDTGATTASMKRKRKLSEKGLELQQAEKAADLFVVMSSFLPKSGKIVSFAVYPSEFGLKHMEEEAVKGPVGLFDDGKVKSDDDDDDDHEIDEEKLRAYEKSRLRHLRTMKMNEDEVDAQDDQSKEKLTKAEKYRVLFERGDEGSDGGDDDEDGNISAFLRRRRTRTPKQCGINILERRVRKSRQERTLSKHSSEDESSGSGRDEEKDDFFIDESSIKFSKGGKTKGKRGKRKIYLKKKYPQLTTLILDPQFQNLFKFLSFASDPADLQYKSTEAKWCPWRLGQRGRIDTTSSIVLEQLCAWQKSGG
ncbi:hypothetical protein MKW92_051053 [Papaver armeniacum]|nr:hypothetical protein MKW92_051053 [Papaver armeniacum]